MAGACQGGGVREMMQDSLTQEYDVVIVGAGIVGLVLAGLCKKKGLSVCLVDRQFPEILSERVEQIPAVFKAWVSALSPSSLNILSELQLGAMVAESSTPYLTMQVVFGDGGGCDFSHHDMGMKHLGAIVNNYRLREALWQRLHEDDLKVHMVKGQPESWLADQGLLRLVGGQCLQTKMLAGADGARSWVRDAMAVSLSSDSDMKDCAYIGCLVHDQAHGGCARQVFDECGVIGLLPGASPNETVFVWSSDAPSHRRGEDNASVAHQQTLLQALKKAFPSMTYRCEGKWRLHPIHSHMASSYSSHRAVLLGDAACAVHPLAGQGLNIGLRQARLLALSLHSAVRMGQIKNYDDAAREYAQKTRGYDALSRQAYHSCRYMMIPTGQFLQSILHRSMAVFSCHAWARKILIAHAMQDEV